MKVSKALSVIANTMTIAYLGELYFDRFGRQAIIKVRYKAYRRWHDSLSRQYEKAHDFAKFEAELRWTLAVEPLARSYIDARDSVGLGDPKTSSKEQLEMLHAVYVDYMVGIATRDVWVRLSKVNLLRHEWRAGRRNREVVVRSDNLRRKQRHDLVKIVGDMNLMPID